MERITLCSQPISRIRGADLADLDRIKSDRRLVKDHHIGRVDDRLGDPYPLLKALGKIVDKTPARLSETTTFFGVCNDALILSRLMRLRRAQ